MNKRRHNIILLVLIILGIGFIALTALVALLPTSGLDIEFSHYIQSRQNPVLDKIMYLISTPGYTPEAPIMIVATSLLFLLFKYKKAAGYTLLTALSGLLSTIVKALVNRPRPSKDIVRIVFETSQKSFPSGHMMFYVIFFGFMIVLMFQLEGVAKWVRTVVIVISLFFIFTIPVSRIYLGAHWFTDVLGGFLLGLPSLYVLAWLYLRKKADDTEAPKPEVV
ncbi:phosphatase PAP2 family protein [Mucilaginibacter pallidiroseus]|nr:phosphatase PAP2 family protein [Mucilaginibacter pallidiroseus]